MASIQAHAAVWLLKMRLKRRLASAKDPARMRGAMNVAWLRAPSGVSVEPTRIGGIDGERVEGPAPGSPLLYLHGGGYVACSPATHRPITGAFASEGFRVFVPDYRLAPEHPFPAALEDALAAYSAIRAETGSPIAIAGDSAGGGLALALMLALREAGDPLPCVAALFSPWTDLAATGASLVENDKRCAMFHGAMIGTCARYYIGAGDARNPLISPLYGDLRGLPPMLIHVGADEVLRDDSLRLAERARASGVTVELKVWPVVPHVWQLARFFIPEARQSLREAAAFLRNTSPKSTTAP